MLKGLGNLANLGNVLKQAMEMKEKIEAMKERLGEERITSSVGGGLVTVTINGKMEVLNISIDPEAIDPNDRGVLETLVKSAINNAMAQAQELMKERMKEMTGGIDIPGLT